MKLNLDRLGSIFDLHSSEHWSRIRLACEAIARADKHQDFRVSTRDVVPIDHGGNPASFADFLAVWWLGVLELSELKRSALGQFLFSKQEVA